MAYDRYDERRGDRPEWRDRDRERSYHRAPERDHRDRDERGFLERAGDQIASWFGDDDGRGFGDRDERGYRRRDFSERERGGRDMDEWRGGRERWQPRGEDRGYRPITGDYGRSEGRMERGDREDRGPMRQAPWDRDEYRRTEFAGSSARSNYDDDHYRECRRRHMEDFDREYDEFRRQNRSNFESDFGSWRERRQSKRELLGRIREHMEVAGSDGGHVGTVDRVAGDRIILTRSDPEAGGVHHSLSCTDLDRIEGDRLMLDCTAEQAKRRWRDESRERALFEREDQGSSGPHMLDRSFSGTYR